jgi:DNA-binding response OmpR family regulator
MTKPRLLYVEDDPDIMTITLLALEMADHFEVRAFDNGAGALAALAEFRPDLLLLDVMMPGIDGPCLMRKVHELPDYVHMPVIFMTAKVQRQEQETYLAMGAIGVITKPFDPMRMPERVEALWMDYRATHHDLPSPPAS